MNAWKQREHRAWAAGFFDGEGYVGLKAGSKGSAKKYLAAAVVQKGRPLLDRFVEVVGFGSIAGPNSKGVYSANYYGYDNVIKLFTMLKPWLGPVKHKQFADAIHLALLQRQRRW